MVTSSPPSPRERGAPARRVAFVLEDALGHVTHAQGLREAARRHGGIDPQWLPVPYVADDFAGRMPGLPFSLRLSLRARARLRRLQPAPDALYFHTQGLTPICLPEIARTPSVISLDATPLNFATIAQAYAGPIASGRIARVKHAWFEAVFARAKGFVTMSAWARDSLVRDYGVPAERVTVVPPGVDLQRWQPVMADDAARSKTRLLFVGGDFARKGGDTLLEAWRGGLCETCELDIVTRDAAIAPAPGLRVHHGLKPGSAEIRALYAQADLFVMPSRGDASPFALLEALACGLPVVATSVGAIAEIVEPRRNGMLVPTGDAGALRQTIDALARCPDQRVAMGRAARETAERRFDAETNYARVIDCVMRCAAEAAS